MVPGGLDVTSYVTRLIPLTELTILLEIFDNTYGGKRYQSAVMPSVLVTARIPSKFS